MPTAQVNDIEINYRIEGDGDETIVLVNGLADDLETWVFQMDDLLGAGYRVLRFDNRGIGQTSAPPGPYTSRMLADDAKGLVDELGISGLPPDGHVDGRHDRRRSTPSTTAPTCKTAHALAARTRRRGRSARGCSRCGPTWRRSTACRSSCAT